MGAPKGTLPPNAGKGRPKGSRNRLNAAAVKVAAATGELPHEFLLRVSRGEKVGDFVPSMADRIDAAKAVAPYYAPKLNATTVDANIRKTVSAEELMDDELAAIATGGS